MKAHALWFVGPGKVDIREEELTAPGDGQVLIETEYSGISAGSEMLLYRNLFPDKMPADLSIPALDGQLTYPLKYGYCLTGRIVQVGDKSDAYLVGKRVFTFHPHQSVVLTQKELILEIPEKLDKRAGIFLPNMESTVGFVMDSQPVIGERVFVFGQGILGLFTTAILSRFPLGDLITVDPLEFRRKISKELGARISIDPSRRNFQEEMNRLIGDDTADHKGADLIIEVSGNPQALQQAINLSAFGGRIVVGSWYGKQSVNLELGGRFHRGQIQIISSQVSTINSRFTGRWTKKRRYGMAWEMIDTLDPSRLITHEIPFSEAGKAYKMLAQENEEVIQIVLKY
jgi:2-desacetyl-2-hydroxyethyl bacteriochlorophyllide A dehydrogenase